MSGAGPGGGQLPLALRGPWTARLEEFLPRGNEEVLCALRALEAGGARTPVLLWGAAGAGKTHLLAGLCAQWTQRGRSAACIGLGQPGLAPALLEGLERCELLCLDDLQALAGAPAWEEALFHLYNRAQAEGRAMVLASEPPPRALPIGLPDLRSRLLACLVMQVRPLDDEGKREMLARRARAFGLELPEEVGRYLLARLPRDTGALVEALERLDWASLVAGRRLTLPFVKSVLEPDAAP